MSAQDDLTRQQTAAAIAESNQTEEQKPEQTQNEDQNDDDDDQQMPISVESLCINCEKNGTTRLLLLRVPFFRDIILESFECPHCFYKNNSVKAA
ncbi:nucleolar zinc-finger protein, partial [Ascosphaera atra]